MSQFQLFPSPSKAAASRNPFRAEYARRNMDTQPSIPLKDFNDKDSQTETLLFHLVDETKSIKQQPKAQTIRSTPVSIPETIHEPRSSSESPSKYSSKNSKVNHWNLLSNDADKVLSPAGSSSHMAARSQKYVSRPKSPVVPMRSIFPQYNPNVPLSQQDYYPKFSDNNRPHRPRELTLTPPPEIDRALGPKTVPASVMNFPTGVLDPIETRYSSTIELKGLWEAANGQRPQDLAGTFNLRMARMDAETFTFGDPHAPFYKMQTYSTDELSITRTNPSKPNSSIPIMMLNLEDRRRRTLPDDGLICILFPRLAAMLALDEAEGTARKQGLSHVQATEAEGKALQRAAAQEACRLTWNRTKRLYELHHPSVSKLPPPALVGAVGIPLSPVRSKYTGILHVTVSTPSHQQQQPPTILITTPLSANAVESAHMAATPRTSTLPLTDADEPLASLDLATMTLSISAATITTTIPSLYAIDSLVTALLTVAISDDSTRPFVTTMPHNNPTKHLSTDFLPPTSNRDTTQEQEPKTQSAELMDKIKSHQCQQLPKSKFKTWFSRTPKEPKSRKIVLQEFDLEKYGRYGPSSSREGEKLPGFTRGCLRVLFWGLDLVVRSLTLIVRFLAWVLVGLTRCVTSEKA
ncbi:hypothetical protein BDV25DRAFT_160232 [Aspergillus avenaceus]|uniref:Uncharacterized protein n=1 Tax=Aspergillus avenaceus TaxID=36643 RepID=A0A5N6TMC8_ASPAV|nr:hypothetical protein BDV25DRAFT_160232 [Aspergillus avenaceus]